MIIISCAECGKQLEAGIGTPASCPRCGHLTPAPDDSTDSALSADRRSSLVGRLVRWAGQRPAVVALTAALIVVTLVSAALVARMWREGLVAQEAVEAQKRRTEEELARTQHLLYANSI